MTRRLLVSSVGSGVGRAILEAVRYGPHRYEVYGTNSIPLDEQDVAGLYRCPPTADRRGFQDAVLGAVWECGAAMVLAGRDADTEPLAEIAGDLRLAGAVVPSGPAPALAAAHDKLHTARLLPERFVPTAAELLDALHIAARWGWPLVVKPRFGFASRNVWLVRSQAELAAALGPDEIAQAFVPGAVARDHVGSAVSECPSGHHSVQVLLGPDSRVLGTITLVPARAGDGDVVAPILAAGMDDVAADLAGTLRRAGCTGPWNVQGGHLDGGGWRAFEVNARLTGWSGARPRLGLHEIDLLYDAFVGAGPGRAT